MPWVGILAEFASDAPDKDRRGEIRRKLRLEAVLSGPRPAEKIVVLDVSQAGLLLYAESQIAVGEEFAVDLPLAGDVDARVVWKRNCLYGCQFTSPISRGAVSATLLKATHDRIAGR